MYLAHRARACSFWLPFLHSSLICFSNVKLLSTVTPRNFSLELPSIENFLIFVEFKLNGDRNKWHLEGFTLKLLWQNQSKRLFIVVSRSDITSKNVLYGVVRGGSRINFRVLQNFTKKIEHRNDVICTKIIDSARNEKVQF